ncbi:hypothetical protein B9G69_015980 [Bdellovibrio sp. SKB1291214]|uniref:hypothetical protein n=1 Tax=Bdellovibrio sp. SKB1291214 TaxID=1732569 RepID=UPI000B518768|nr:hypothetical protein [Bdellovibrio sp. SKB1291214]UYL08543.1 hypothetical protein B9G69_015980 [Bdellovibrio sp. SKB1291214]
MTIKQITKCIFVFAALLTSQQAYSSATVESEFELVLPKQFQKNLIEEKWKTLINKEFQANWQFPDQTVSAQNGVQVELKGVSLSLKTQLQKPDLSTAQTQLILQSKDLSAQMTIASISVDQWIEQTVNGITGRFHLQASCANVVLNMKAGMGAFSVAVSPEVASAAAGGEVEDVSLSWQPDAWSVQAFNCIGADGFSDIVNEQISQISMDSAAFVNPKKALLISYLNEYVGKINFDFSAPRELVSGRSDIKVSMMVDSFDDTNPEQMIAKGRVIMTFTRSSQTGSKSLTLSKDDPKYSASTQAMIRLPGGLAKEIITQAYSADSWVHQFYSNQISGFSTVMNSRFVQWFVWPELMDYPKSSKFLFNVYSNKDPKITGSGLKYGVSFKLLSQMQAPKNGKYIPFMNFVVPFSSNVAVGIADSKASVKFTNTSLDLKYSWDASYVKKYSPKTRFAGSTIEDKILGAISGKTMSVALPAIPLMDGVNLKVKKASTLSNSDLLLQLAP